MAWIELTRQDGKKIDINMDEVRCVLDNNTGARLTPVQRGAHIIDEIYVVESRAMVSTLRQRALS